MATNIFQKKKLKNMKVEQQQNIEKFIDMVKDVRICMMITNEKDAEHLSGRPMAINKIDDDGTMWFFTKASSHKVDEINESKNVAFCILRAGNNVGVFERNKGKAYQDRVCYGHLKGRALAA